MSARLVVAAVVLVAAYIGGYLAFRWALHTQVSGRPMLLLDWRVSWHAAGRIAFAPALWLDHRITGVDIGELMPPTLTPMHDAHGPGPAPSPPP